jgi:hypothetical protein
MDSRKRYCIQERGSVDDLCRIFAEIDKDPQDVFAARSLSCVWCDYVKEVGGIMEKLRRTVG